MTFLSSGIIPQIQRYSVMIAGLVALLLVLAVVIKLVELYQRRLNLNASWSSDTRHLRPVGDRGLLIDGRAADDSRVGFSVDQIPELGVSSKFLGEDDSTSPGKDVKGDSGGWRKECVVCLEEFLEGELLRKLHECQHFFHQECVDAWLLTHRSCPLCRTDLSLDKEEETKGQAADIDGRPVTTIIVDVGPGTVDTSTREQAAEDGPEPGTSPGSESRRNLVAQTWAADPLEQAHEESPSGETHSSCSSCLEISTESSCQESAGDGALPGPVPAQMHCLDVEAGTVSSGAVAGQSRKQDLDQ